jgi:hypothetical protein
LNRACVKHGDPITIVLKHVANTKTTVDGKPRDSRLVHTTVYMPLLEIYESFVANDDDRPEHRIADEGVTWLRGHVPFWTRAAKDLVVNAEYADAKETR